MISALLENLAHILLFQFDLGPNFYNVFNQNVMLENSIDFCMIIQQFLPLNFSNKVSFAIGYRAVIVGGTLVESNAVRANHTVIFVMFACKVSLVHFEAECYDSLNHKYNLIELFLFRDDDLTTFEEPWLKKSQ